MAGRQTQTSRMDREEFDELNSLCIAHGHIFDYRKSPEPGELAAFDDLLRQSPYVVGMLKSGKFRIAIGVLEGRFQEGLAKAVVVREECADQPSEELKRANKLEREVRFIHRCAALSRHVLDSDHVFLSESQTNSRERAIKSLAAALTELERLAPDPYLQDAYLKDQGAADIEELTDRLPAAIWHLETAKPEYAMTRRTNERRATEIRQLVDRLVDACHRLYANCDAGIINRLLDCAWLGLENGRAVTPKDIKTSLERKMSATEIRADGRLAIPQEDLLSADMREEWRKLSPHPDNWMPGYVLEASWLRA